MKTPKFWMKNDIWSYLLTPLGAVYGAVVQWRIRHHKPYHCGAKVICIGNITAGGVGKTPVALAMAEKYLQEGKKVFFVTRGYKGKRKNILVDLNKHSVKETGDEARLLAGTAPTIISPKRELGAKMAVEMGAEVIIMDDGFQNPGLYKDESWLVFDGATGVGNGKFIPAGPLRETLADGEKRADYILIMGKDKTGLADKCTLPVFFGRLEALPIDLERKKVFAFAGIGHPEKFYETLRLNGYDVVFKHDYPDHYAYELNDVRNMKVKAKTRRLPLVTTEKDYVKIPVEEREGIYCLKVRAVIEGL